MPARWIENYFQIAAAQKMQGQKRQKGNPLVKAKLPLWVSLTTPLKELFPLQQVYQRLASLIGLEPMTSGLENPCSIQLSYRDKASRNVIATLDCPLLAINLSRLTLALAARRLVVLRAYNTDISPRLTG